MASAAVPACCDVRPDDPAANAFGGDGVPGGGRQVKLPLFHAVAGLVALVSVLGLAAQNAESPSPAQARRSAVSNMRWFRPTFRRASA